MEISTGINKKTQFNKTMENSVTDAVSKEGKGKDYFKVAKGLYGPAISSLTRGLLSQDQIENNPLDPYLKNSLTSSLSRSQSSVGAKCCSKSCCCWVRCLSILRLYIS